MKWVKSHIFSISFVIMVTIICLYVAVDVTMTRSRIGEIAKSIVDESADFQSWPRPATEQSPMHDLIVLERQSFTLNKATNARIHLALQTSSVEFERYLLALIGAGESISSRSDIRIIGSNGDDLFLRSDQRVYLSRDTGRVFVHHDARLWDDIKREILDKLKH